MNLSNALRESIKAKALAYKFKEREAALEKGKTMLADTLYFDAFPDWKAVAKFAPKWVSMEKYIRIDCEGFSLWGHRNGGPGQYLSMSEERAFPQIITDELTIKKGHPCWAAAQSIVKEHDAIKEEKQALENELNALLFPCRTLKALREAWPEGEQFFPNEERPAMALVPIGLAAKVSRKLGLKAGKRDAATVVIEKAAAK